MLTSSANGGAELYAISLADLLRQSGMASALIAPPKASKTGLELVWLRRMISRRLSSSQGTSAAAAAVTAMRWAQSRVLQPVADRMVASTTAPVIVVNNGGYPGAPLAIALVAAAHRARRKTILLVHSMARQRFLGRLEARCDQYVFGRLEMVVTMGPNTTRAISVRRGLAGSRLRSIRTAIPIPVLPDPEAARTALGIAESTLVVGMLAAFVPGKRHDLLLDALRSLKSRDLEGMQLLFAGTGPTQADVRQRAARLGLEKRIVFAGQARTTDVLAASDVIALPSDVEGLPLSILEAVAAGRPVVATDVGDVSSAVIPDRTGILVPPDDAAALADALELLHRDADARRRMGAEARRVFEEAFTMRQFANSWMDLIAEVSGLGTTAGACPEPRN